MVMEAKKLLTGGKGLVVVIAIDAGYHIMG